MSIEPSTPGVESTYRFARLPEWILYHEDLSDIAVRVYATLDRFDGRDCIPALATVGERIGKSEDSVRRAMRALGAVGAIIVEHRSVEGRQTSNRYLLAGDKPFRPRESATLPPADLPGTGVAPMPPEPEQEKREQEEPSSSLRSDGVVREESGSDTYPIGAPVPAPKDEGQQLARTYWDAFIAANDGLRPSTPFLQLAAVARKALKSGLLNWEVVAGMLATKVMTGEAVVKEAIRIRREQENRPATGTIDPLAVHLFKAWAEWRHTPPLPSERAELLSTLSIMLRWPTMAPAEVGARLGGFARAHSSTAIPTIDDLKAVPLESRPLKPDDIDLILVFRKYATGPRLEG